MHLFLVRFSCVVFSIVSYLFLSSYFVTYMLFLRFLFVDSLIQCRSPSLIFRVSSVCLESAGPGFSDSFFLELRLLELGFRFVFFLV